MPGGFTRAQAQLLHTPLEDVYKRQQQEILGFDGGIQMFDMRGGATVFVGMQKNSLQELYVLAGGKALCISAFNSPLLSARAVQPLSLIHI